jgi:hypothetical protein
MAPDQPGALLRSTAALDPEATFATGRSWEVKISAFVTTLEQESAAWRDSSSPKIIG